ncbi:MAG: sulfate permease [Bacteroidetes bacterium]|jgi:SulP family sulfate permease|nr:sulfate permease [Bacteroidota bacterium]
MRHLLNFWELLALYCKQALTLSRIKAYFPIANWLPKYRKQYWRGDLLAGLTVGVMLIPQGMAYGLLAGLPPIYGLYASIVPLLLYAVFGTSRQLSVGPTAVVALLVAAGIQAIGRDLPTATVISLSISAALLAGIIQVALGFLRLGILVNFLALPVIGGFTSAAAFIIGFSQLKYLLGIPLKRNSNVFSLLTEIAQHITQTHIVTLAIGLGSIALLLLLKRFAKGIPGSLVVVAVGIGLSAWFQLDKLGVAIVGNVPEGLPPFEWPDLSLQRIREILPLAVTVCIISFIESVAIAKTIEGRYDDYRVVPNQELIALGLSKIGGAFFQSFPTTGSFTRSAVNDESGGKTGLSSVVSALVVALTLLFLTPFFYYLPKAILAAIIVVAVINLVDYREAQRLWNTDGRDFTNMVVTFAATLVFGIQNGILTGVLLSLGIMIYRNARPHITVLGQLPGSRHYRSTNRFPEARDRDEILILRFDAQLYFGNSTYFRDEVEAIVRKRDSKPKLLILDASSIHDIDSSGVKALEEVLCFLEERDIRFYISGVIGPVRDILFRNELMSRIGKHNQFLHIQDAVDYYYSHPDEDTSTWTADALQTNAKERRRKWIWRRIW